ncbi:MAG TPA: recombinase family protein [Longimicrobium sp.]
MQLQKTAIIYCRVSSLDQVEGTSLETQEQICREHAAKLGYSVLTVFIERGESAKSAERTQLKAALAYCSSRRKTPVDFFVVYKLDRFARNVEDHVTVRMKLRQAGTTLISATEPIDGTPIGKLLEVQMAGWAEFDNSIRAERSKSGMVARVRQGVWVWMAPLGYYRPTPGGNLQPHPEEATLIRILFEEFAKGTHTYESIAKYLNARGFRTKSGYRIRRQQVEKLLHNPIYAGIIEAFGERVIGTFEPLISLELWQQCQPGSREHKPHAPAHLANNPLFPLRRVIVCSACGKPLTGSRSTGRTGARYAYYHHPQQGCTKATFLPKEAFERAFTNYLATLRVSPGAEALYRQAVIETWRDSGEIKKERATTVQREIKRLESERQRIFELHRAGVYSDTEFAEQKALINDQINGKSRLAEDETADDFNAQEALEYALEFIRQPDRTWNRLEPLFPARLRFQRLVSRGAVVFDGDRFGTSDLGLIYRQIEAGRSGKSYLVALVRQEWKQVTDELNRWAFLVREVNSNSIQRR